MQDPTEALDVNESTTSGALAYAAGVWSSLRLEPRELGVDDVTAVFQHAHRTFVHVRAFEEGFQNTFVVIISDADGVEGHILIDLQAEYADPILDCPSQDYHRITTASDIRKLIPQIDARGANPFAVLELGRGTYMQVYRTLDGFEVEHQMVNLSSHYKALGFATAQETAEAMASYASGDHGWLEAFMWERVEEL